MAPLVRLATAQPQRQARDDRIGDVLLATAWPAARPSGAGTASSGRPENSLSMAADAAASHRRSEASASSRRRPRSRHRSSRPDSAARAARRSRRAPAATARSAGSASNANTPSTSDSGLVLDRPPQQQRNVRVAGVFVVGAAAAPRSPARRRPAIAWPCRPIWLRTVGLGSSAGQLDQPLSQSAAATCAESSPISRTVHARMFGVGMIEQRAAPRRRSSRR